MLRRFLLAGGLFAVLAMVLTWPAVLYVGGGVPADFGDPLLNTWLFWWNAHALPLTAAWWNAPAFYPSQDVLAFSEHLLGFAWLTGPLLWLGVSPLAVYTLAMLATYVTAGLGAWLLARALTRREDAALLAGIAFMAAPYRAAQVSHVQVLMACWMPVTLFALHQYLETRRRRWLAVFASAWILQGLTNGYYLVFLAIPIGLWIAYFACRRGTWRAGVSMTVASVAVATAMLPLLLHYRTVHAHYGFRRMPDEIAGFSADLLSLFDASPALLLWGHLRAFHRPEGELFPGLVLVAILLGAAVWSARARAETSRPVRVARVALGCAIAVAGLLLVSYAVYGRWRIDVGGLRVSVLDPRRPLVIAAMAAAALVATWPGLRAAWMRRSPLLFYAGTAVVLFILALGPTPTIGGKPLGVPGPYAVLQSLPGFSGLRVPARLWMPALACLSAALALAWGHLPIPASRRPWVACLTGALILAEGMPAGIRIVAAPSPWPSIVQPDGDVPIVQVPALGTDGDTITMYRAMAASRRVVAGYSGYFPPSWFVMSRALAEQDTSLLDSLAALGPADVLLDRWSDRRGRWGRWLRAQALRAPAQTEGRFTLYPLAARPLSRRPAQLGARIPVVSISATVHDTLIREAMDGRLETAWFTPQQVTGDTITIDFGTTRSVGALRLWQAGASLDYSRGLAIERSDDGRTWTTLREGSTAGAAWQAAEDAPVETPLTFALDGCAARYVRLRQTVLDVHRWAIHELAAYAPTSAQAGCASGRR